MNDDQLLRYSRQIMLPQIDVAGQQALLDATVLIVGLGGLGSPAALYLAATGVGHLILNDFDKVELSNLQRQIIHGSSRIGQPKTASAKTTLGEINPDIQITLINEKLDEDGLTELAGNAGVVLDGSDNFTTRHKVNRACRRAGTPLVSGAVVRFEGQLSVFDPRQPGNPCYACLYAEGDELNGTCSENGVLAPVAGVMGSLQATEAIKVLLGLGTTLTGRVLVYDALHQDMRTIKLKQDPDCAVCGDRTR